MRITDWRNGLKPKLWIDVKDSKGNWLLASISDVKNDHAYITYDGFDKDTSEVVINLK